MRGVSVEDRRIMICVGGPYIPKDAYVASSHSFNIEDFAADLENLSDEDRLLAISKLLRLDDTRSEFINSIGRCKDPRGEQRSIVFLLGLLRSEVDILMKQNVPVSKPYIVQPLRKGGMLRDGVFLARLWLDTRYDYWPYYFEITIPNLPLLAWILSRTANTPNVRASEIVPHLTSEVIETAKRYEHVLRWYNIKLEEKQGGINFCAIRMTLDHFQKETNNHLD